ncbi:ATP-dependent DNA helicase RecG [Collinsella sp. AGMB00827]|uniref:Probable DNA 3'-5' helicase RecG n=1 Tax=Collinsella ureilytica TaxID=2869515 RepID=A0ABS7MI97_9ACTN|nr:ATP-dependent DNA helicase RecG [Collinsella urealyticum]MBY4796821.1 ATP-dependent DNA helicase RecG [Collinsella urealyticum]
MAAGFMLPSVARRLACSRYLETDVSRLRYVSGSRARALERLGLNQVRDLLYHIPRRYLDFSATTTIEAAPLASVVSIVAEVDRVIERRPRPRMVVTEVSLFDETGVMKAVFFKQPWLSRQIKSGNRLALMGKLEFAYGFKQMKSPIFERVSDDEHTNHMVPIHPVGEGISVAWMRRIMSEALADAVGIFDPMPAVYRASHQLMSRAQALRAIHFPQSLNSAEQARRRLAYEEVLYLQLGLRMKNEIEFVDPAVRSHRAGEAVQALRRALPFELTYEQEGAVADILHDMADTHHAMSRLLLGDVGTGKTAVATLALGAAKDGQAQACVMAPTSVLAQQYAIGTGPLLDRANISWALLTGATPAQERSEILCDLAAGTLDVLVGTHAVLSEDVVFSDLGLVVIDEQHRFGVGQRAALRAKGPGADLLVMSATPIPRTLALALYGDVDVSRIRKRPCAGAGVATHILDPSNRDLAYGAIRDAIAKKQRAYIICPLVAPGEDATQLDDGFAPGENTEDGAASALVAATAEVERIAQIFPQAHVGLLHGRMSAAEKDQAIDQFRRGVTDILVATTVVEVGVDVPEATVMLIENGERFGLATLHQLRGRIGRGSAPGVCFIISSAADKQTPAYQRLSSLERITDGFELAEIDLRLRHEGEILGYRQSGGVSLRFVDLVEDQDLIEAANYDARQILEDNPDLSAPETLPLRIEVLERFGSLLKEAGGA